jgi:arginyl-tRNA synthetase
MPFGGAAAPDEPELAAARLVLADAARAVLAAGLALTGVTATDRL